MIDTEHYQLQLMGPEHAELWFDYTVRTRSTHHVWEPARVESYYTLEGAQQRIAEQEQNVAQRRYFPFIALSRDTGQMMGACTFSNVVYGVMQACHMGYAIDSERQGRGHMHEIVQAAISYMFEEVKLHRVMANYMPANVRSERLLQRLGFEREGYARAYLKIAGKWEDHVLTAKINPMV